MTNQVLSYMRGIGETAPRDIAALGGKVAAIPQPVLAAFESVFVVGSGVEYAAALAGKNVFQEAAGLHGADIYPAVPSAFAYELPEADLKRRPALLIALDSTGGDPHCLAAVRRAKEAGIPAVAVSCAAGDLTKAADHALLVEADGGFGGYDLYYKLLLALVALALAAAKARGGEGVDERAVLDDLAGYAAATAALSQSGEALYDRAARLLADAVNFETMGTGADYAAAWMTRAAIYRELGVMSTVEESEDWLHVNMLQLTPEAFGHFAFASKENPACDRTFRTLRFVCGLGRPTVVFTDADTSTLNPEALVIPIPSVKFPFLRPLFAPLFALPIVANLKR